MSHTEYSDNESNLTKSNDEIDGGGDVRTGESTTNGPRQLGNSNQNRFDHKFFDGSNTRGFFPPYLYPPYNISNPAAQLQFYEARMRDHAAAYAQYANAAAGAALAAAQLASSAPIYQNMLPDPISFYPVYQPSFNVHSISHPISPPNGSVPPTLCTIYSADGNSNRKGTNSQNMISSCLIPSTKKQKRAITRQRDIDPKDCTQPLHTEDSRRTRSKREQTLIPITIPSSTTSSSGTSKRNKLASTVHKNSRLLSVPNKKLDVSGKSAVRALYEICDKRRWSAPQFIEYDVTFNPNTGSSSSAYSHTDFIMGLEINGVELSRSRGASKKSAQQDAARKALSKLFPGTVFDVYGILLDLGTLDKSDYFFSTEADKIQDHKVESPGNVPDDVGEELAPSLASRLAIYGDNCEGRLSPTPSEDSSISTTFSLQRSKVSIVSGGPFHSTKNRPHNVFPSASTTSGASSASEDIDDDEYLLSRGASICSTLLNVMVQIDDRIRDQPTYTFDIYTRANDTPGPNSSKRKGVECNGEDGAMISKRRTATKNGKLVTLHQTSFACTATLHLHEPKLLSRENDNCDETVMSTKCLRAVGTGTTKRSARHVASAKLLALLFPDCKGMVEVKAAAEIAQERYVSKRTGKRAGHLNDKFTSRLFNRNDVDQEKKNNSYLLNLFKAREGLELCESFLQKLVKVSGKNKTSKDPPGSDLAKLSLSESKEQGCMNDLKSKSGSVQAAYEKAALDKLVDEALYQLSLNDDEVKATIGCVEENDVTKTVLRRASIEDSKDICHLIEKINQSKNDLDLKNIHPHFSYSWLQSSTIWNYNFIVLLLYRSDEILGCAVLKLGFSLHKGRNLHVIHMFHKEHYPKERFLDCLLLFSGTINYHLEDESTQQSQDVKFSRHFLSRFIEKQISLSNSSRVTKESEEHGSIYEDQGIRKPLLQVVEEEEGEDDEKSDHVHKKRLKVN